MMTRTTDTDDLRGGKVSADTWIALRVSLVVASASEVILAELIRRRIWDNMANNESERAGGGGNWEVGENVLCYPPAHSPNVRKLLNLQGTSSSDAQK
jgi:hypothetical protein